MSDVEVRRNAPLSPSSPHSGSTEPAEVGSTEFVVDYPLPEGEGRRPPPIDGPAAELQYSAREKPSRRWLRRLRTPALILVACVLAGALLPRSWRHAQLLRLTSACFDHEVPPGTVAVAFSVDKDHPLASDPRYQDGDPRGRGLVPRYWRDLHERLRSSPLRTSGTAFLGARRGAGGTPERLVAVDVVQRGLYDEPLGLAWRVYDRGSVRSGPNAVNVGVTAIPFVQPLRMGAQVTVFAGQPDPADDAHFTIEVEARFHSRRYVIDGWLRGDNVVLMPRDPPDVTTTQPAPSSPALFPTPQLRVIPPSAGPAGR